MIETRGHNDGEAVSSAGIVRMSYEFFKLLTLSWMEMLAIIISIISLFTSIWFVRINWKNSRKQKIYSEDIFSSSILVTSLKTDWGFYSTNKNQALLLKVYSLNQWTSRNYKITTLEFLKSKDMNEMGVWFENVLSDSWGNDNRSKTFITKYHAIEYALFVYKLEPKFEKTPFWNEYWCW